MDIEKVMTVIHVDRPYGCISFTQGSGRAGRAGELVRSILLISRAQFERLKGMNARMLTADDAAMQEYIITEGCRRKPLTRYLDGESFEKDCSEIEGRLCDHCLVTVEGTEAQKRNRDDEAEALRKRRCLKVRDEQVKEFQRQKSIHMQYVKNMIERLQDQCPLCWCLKRTDDVFHDAEDCSLREFFLENVSYWKKKHKYSKDSACFVCSVPGDMCPSYCEEKRCVRKDVIIPICLVMFRMGHYLCKKIVRELADREMDEMKDYERWLIKECRVMQMNGTNAFAVFECLCREFR